LKSSTPSAFFFVARSPLLIEVRLEGRFAFMLFPPLPIKCALSEIPGGPTPPSSFFYLSELFYFTDMTYSIIPLPGTHPSSSLPPVFFFFRC